MQLRVLLADDQPEVRSALRLLLEQEPGIQVLGEVVDACELLSRVRATSPDLALLDWELPGCSAAELLAALRSSCVNLKVIALSGRPEARHAALAAGADTFVSKGDPPEALLRALRAIGVVACGA